VRIVSATNADLRRAIAEGRFREDLYFRLNVIELRVPPLAERPEDILPLTQRFLAELGATLALAPDARDALVEHDWPGNVRELQNRIRRATLVARGEELTRADLDLVAVSARDAAPQESAREPDPERDAIEEALTRTKGIVSNAAAELGISRQALYRRMERLGIVIERRLK
jgi:DNA-binding NtrC family response regulator